MSFAEPGRRRMAVRILTFAAVMAALSVILKVIPSIQLGSTQRISFRIVPIMLCSMYCGPGVGMLTALVADITGFFVQTMSSTFLPGFTLTELLRGLLPGLIVYCFGRRVNKWSVLVVTVVDFVCLALLLQSFWLGVIYPRGGAAVGWTGYWAMLLTRLPGSALTAAANLFGLSVLTPVMNRLLPADFLPAVERAGKPDRA